ncbi:MAG: hypothetical protein HA496_05175 [Thaumarchaeota archaeon]|jgi:hypothetical protein|nr:hypothetical protein [Nitrososphaerota archaeon]
MRLIEILWLILGFALLMVLPGLLSGSDVYSTLVYLCFFTVFLVISEKKVKRSQDFSKRNVRSSS